MINAYPTPTSTARLNNYAVPRIQPQNYDQGDVRMDEQITTKDSIFARWSIQDTTTISPSTYVQSTIPGISTPVSLSDEASFAAPRSSPHSMWPQAMCASSLQRSLTTFVLVSTATAGLRAHQLRSRWRTWQ